MTDRSPYPLTADLAGVLAAAMAERRRADVRGTEKRRGVAAVAKRIASIILRPVNDARREIRSDHNMAAHRFTHEG